ncbi:EF-hand domain-containing protein [Saccharopolyspora phatthalungensis]|uniref:Ca2+-binding EF-hand superfamily protein n=1 Tax=Saccharopolyspora phatthalungensis TaxID=664693 RepID=A0A840QFJ2_9PSEU|nr:EF-hand domain-containing protein [Saccharopolyspora phatthalungensis]MBB5159206.1 Ca2+-binding EF-hand superfamily protein [Saccharopolyspora phatthalungensis]
MSEQFLRQKHDRLFQFWDTNRDGVIEWADVQAVVEGVSNAFGWAEDSAQKRRLSSATRRWWDDMFAPYAVNGELARDPFVTCLHNWATADRSAFREVLAPAAEAYAAMGDLDGDGTVNEDEYVKVFGSSIQMSEDESRDAFRRLDRDGDGLISVEEFAADTVEYFTATDRAAPGNWLLGPIEPSKA